MNRAKSVELDIDTITTSAEFSPMMTNCEQINFNKVKNSEKLPKSILKLLFHTFFFFHF